MGLWRRGAVSCGGSCRLLPTRGGGHVAVSLPRREDLEAVPAWLELEDIPPTTPATWSAVAAHLARRDLEAVLARAEVLGLPVARVGEVQTSRDRSADGDGVVRHALGPAAPRAVAGLLVVDLSALWAGPLCGDLLAGAGASVVKVESTARPTARGAARPRSSTCSTRRKRSVGARLRARGRPARAAAHRRRGRTWSSRRAGRAPSSSWGSWRPTPSAPGAPRCGSPSPATDAPATRPAAWPSATTPQPPAVSWCGPTGPRSSARTPSPTRSRG